ncbi:glycine zipper family protein [Muricoccus nepalensis]|nr:glycine zipper family protein [Roseomonas nepalensis]
MLRTPMPVLLFGLLSLGACAVAPPSGPRVYVTPPEGKDLARFQGEDAGCRNYAQQSIGFGAPQQAANAGAAGSAAVGTAVGAAAGAIVGAAAGNPGAGAAIGAGGGLLTGSAIGSGNAQASAGELQQQYDVAYVQCMAASGNRAPAVVAAPYASVPYAVYGSPAYYGYPGYYPPYFGAPAVTLGFFGGYGARYHRPAFHRGFYGGYRGFHGGGFQGGFRGGRRH